MFTLELNGKRFLWWNWPIAPEPVYLFDEIKEAQEAYRRRKRNRKRRESRRRKALSMRGENR